MDGLLVVLDIEVGAHHDFLNSDLFEPLLVLGVVRDAINVVVWTSGIVVTTFVVQDYVLEDWRVPSSLNCQVIPVWAVVLFDAIVRNLRHVLVQEVDPYLTERVWNLDVCDCLPLGR